MSKEMKTIMESFRRKVISEQQLNTIGDLRKLIKVHRALEAGKEAGKKAAEMAIEQIPIVSNLFSLWKGAKDSVDMLKKLYGADDKFKTNTGLDKLNIDDNVSKIVDDQIEVAFLNDLLKSMENLNDNDPIPDINKVFQDFLKKNFKQHSVEAK
jgi:hypothetical protein